MEKIYPIGTIVKPKDSKLYIMITGTLPLYNLHGKLGYFDYSACLYPVGQVNQNSLFLNEEDIEEVLFTGLEDENFDRFREEVTSQLKTVTYPRFTLDMIKEAQNK